MKTITKATPKPLGVAKKKPAPLNTIESAYSLSLTDDARRKMVEIVEALEYINEQAKIAATITVTDDASDKAAADVTVNITKARKVLEDLQKYFTSPLEGSKKSIIANFKDWLKVPTAEEDRLRAEGGRYFQQKENERLEAERRRQADELERQRKARALGRVPVPTAPVPVVTETPRTVEAENGSRSYKMMPMFSVIDLEQVPDQYITRALNTKLVQATIDGGVRQIPGLLITEEARAVVK